LHVWEVATGKEVWQAVVAHKTFPAPMGPTLMCVAFAPDGRTLVSGHRDWTVRLWEVATGQERRRFLGHRGEVAHLAFAPDGRTFASAAMDQTVLVWDLWGRPGPVSPENREQAWTRLASGNAAEAYQAAAALIGTPRQAVALLRQHMRPAVAADAGRVARLIADLDKDRFAVREKARKELEALGEQAEPALRKALAGKPSAQTRRSLEELLEQLSQEWTRQSRALEVLEYAGIAEARPFLKELAGGMPGARLTEEARACLGRLDRRASRTR
jgi:hypothetical protein